MTFLPSKGSWGLKNNFEKSFYISSISQNFETYRVKLRTMHGRCLAVSLFYQKKSNLYLISKEKSQILYQIEIDKDYVFFDNTQYLLKSFQMVVIQKV